MADRMTPERLQEIDAACLVDADECVAEIQAAWQSENELRNTVAVLAVELSEARKALLDIYDSIGGHNNSEGYAWRTCAAINAARNSA